MKNIDKFVELLFKTKNYDKIIPQFNKLSLKEKEACFSVKKVRDRIYKIADINFLISILIDLPYEVRIGFLREFPTDKFEKSYEQSIINFLSLKNFNDFDISELANYGEMTDKTILTQLFKRLSIENLRKIISNNYHSFISNYAFVAYSVKSPSLKLDSEILNNVYIPELVVELKKRCNRKDNVTLIDMDDFFCLSKSEQSSILSNGNFVELENESINRFKNTFSLFSKDELKEKFKELVETVNYSNLLEMQVIMFIVDDEFALELIKLFFTEHYKLENVDDRYLRSMIFHFRKLNEKTKELLEVCKLKTYSLIYYLNTGIIDTSISGKFKHLITFDQYQKTNTKKLNRIIKGLSKMLEKEEIDESKRNSLDLLVLAYKLYFIFGYDNSVELLNGKFGYFCVSWIDSLLRECKINNVKLEKVNNGFEPVLKDEFISFLFGDKKDVNSHIRKLIAMKMPTLFVQFGNFHNNFKRFQLQIGNKIHWGKLAPVLLENPFLLLPDEYKLTNDLLKNVIKSCNVDEENKARSSEIVADACNFYHDLLEKRVSSSIPRVTGGTNDGYTYEVLRLDDPIIMTLGYLTGCCFRINGASKEFLRFCSESPHARVIVIRNVNNEICAMVPVVRNGNVINGNSIECNSKASEIKVYEALKCACDDIIRASRIDEEEPLVAGCVTDLHKRVSCYNKQKIDGHIFPIMQDEFYTNYDEDTYIISSDNNVDENDFRFYTPQAIYMDDRPEILISTKSSENQSVDQEVQKRVKAINYKIGYDDPYPESYGRIICSEDWYLRVSYGGYITGQCLDKDYRAKEEFEAVKKYLEAKFESDKFYHVNVDFSEVKSTCEEVGKRKVLKRENNTL